MLESRSADPDALAIAVLRDAQTLASAVQTAGLVPLADSLRRAAQSAWVNDPPRARAAADRLGALCAIAQSAPTLTAPAELVANTAWAEGIARLAESDLAGALHHLDDAARQWQCLHRALPAAQARLATLMPLSLMGRYDQALQVGQRCETELMAAGDALGAAKTALNLGSLAMQRDRYAEAVTHYRRAAVRLARAGDRQHSILADIGLADALGYAGNLAEAHRIYERAIMRARKHSLPVLAAQAAHGLALVDLAEGRYTQALAELVRAQQAFADMGVQHFLLEVERDLADAYLELRLWPEALALYESLMLRLQAQDNAATLPWLRLQRARALAGAGLLPQAREALAVARDEFAVQDNPAGAARATLALLDASVASWPSDEPVPSEEALRLAADARALEPQLPPQGAARARWLQAVARRRGGDALAAEALLAPLCARPGPGVGLSLQALAWTELGECAHTRGDLAAAARCWEQAISASDALLAALPAEEFQFAALGGHLQAYRRRLHLALQDGDPVEVLRWLDRQRARVLADRLGRITEPTEGAAPAVELLALRARLEWLRRQQQRRAEEGDSDATTALQPEMQALEGQVLEAARRARALRADAVAPLRGGHPLAALDVAALCRHFDGPRALVAYGAAQARFFAVVVAQGRVQPVTWLTASSDLAAEVEGLRFQLDAWRAGSDALATHTALLLRRATVRLQRLHALLWAPIQPLLGGAREVSVIGTDLLQALPFAALHDGVDWLDTRLCVRTVPSAALALPAAAAPPAAATALVAGASSGLAHVRAELAAVQQMLPQAIALTEDAATVAALLEALPSAGLLHLAGHAEFRADAPAFSALHLHDGHLTVADLDARRVAARLVVLSACDTARGLAACGDESLGLTRAFLLAGAPEVLASQWAVDDEAAALWMRHFYATWLANGRQTAAAAQQARARLRQTHPHPVHWAAFALHGAGLDSA